MPASIGVNLRVTGHCSQGGRRYMEDLFSVAYQQTEDERDLEYAFFGIYDGHGGGEAAAFAKEHLMDIIVKQRGFWSDNDDDVLRAIRNGYMLTHLNMWKELDKWPKTVTGLPSTAGTTASVAFIRRGKIYIGHVGDSAIVLGYQQEGSDGWLAKPLTLDHKPESSPEMERIQQSGGKVVSKAGVPRVVWNRPRVGHKGPIKESTPVDEIPFLAVARSLGDLWSYNAHTDEFIVSPDPDVGVLTIDTANFRCLIFGTDGLWNMINAEEAVRMVQGTERHNEAAVVAGDGAGSQPRDWRNPSKSLVDNALERWSKTRMRADNTSVVTLMLDPPGPPRAAVLRSRTAAQRAASSPPPHSAPAPPAAAAAALATTSAAPPAAHAEADRQVPQNGLTIMTRYSEEEKTPERVPLPPCTTLDGRFALAAIAAPASPPDVTAYGDPADSCFIARLLSRTTVTNTLSNVFDLQRPGDSASEPRDITPPPETSLATPEDKSGACDAGPPCVAVGSSSECPDAQEEAPADPPDDVESIQINEVSSSSPTDCPAKPRGRKQRQADSKEPSQPVTNSRALRSHDADTPQRPHTRLTSNRARPVLPALPAPLDRVVILSRARGVPAPPVAHVEPVPPPVPSEPRPPLLRRAEPKVVIQPDSRIKREIVVRVTRSRDVNPQPKLLRNPAQPVASKEPRRAPEAPALRPGNGARAPGPRRSAPAPAARRERSETPDARPEHSKENFARGAGSRRRCGAAGPRTRAPPPPERRRTRRCETDEAELPVGRRLPARRCRADDEVHSTTGEHGPAAVTCSPVATATIAVRPRALRSRNDAELITLRKETGAKRHARAPDEQVPPSKVPKMAEKGFAAEKGARLAGKRAGPWSPALALRNRLRKRLAK